MSFEDERIVKMTFDNKAFQKNIESTIRALERLDKSMKLEDVSPKAFDNFVDGVEESDRAMESFGESVDGVKAKFSALQIVGFTVLSELTRFAISSGKKIYDSTLGQIKSGGLTRALNIEAAKFQMEGLHHSWEEVAEDIDFAVKGTAYGMDSAAKAASQLLASQIQAGDQMKVSLRGISGLAAVTNSSYDDIADIFTTVAGNGRLMGDQLNRISYRGINAAQKLMEYFNNVKGITVKTEAEIRDMVSKGKVSFMDFAAAMDYAFGEHAKDANKTFTGAMSNMKAALSRIGEKFLTPWNEFQRRLAVSVIPIIDRVKESLQFILPVYDVILNKVASWTEHLTKNYKFQQAIINIAVGIWGWIQNIIGALYELGIAMPNIQSLSDLFERVTRVLLLNEAEGRKVREIVKIIVRSISILITIIQALLYILKPIFDPIISFLKGVEISTDGVVNKSADIIDKINYIIKLVAILLHMGIEKAVKLIIIAIKGLVLAIKFAGGVIGLVILGVTKLISILKLLVDAVRKNSSTILNIIKSVGEGFIKFYDLIKEIFGNLTDGMSTFLDGAKTKTSELWEVINGLTGSKKLTVNLGINTKATPLNPQSVIPKNALSNVNALTNSTKQYSSAAQEAEKAGKKASGGAALQQWGGSGQMMKGMINTPELIKQSLRDLGDGADRAATQVENGADRTSRAIDGMARKVNASADSIWLFNGASDKIDGAKSVMGDKGSTIFDGFISKIESAKGKLDKAKDRIAEHFTNFYAVLSDVIIIGGTVLAVAITIAAVKIVGAILSLVNMLPQLIGALNNAAKGFKYQGAGEMFKGLALTILAIGALVVSIAIVSKFVDPEAFKQFMKMTILLVMAISALALAVAQISTAMALMNMLNNLPNAKPLLTRLTAFTNQTKQLFIGLAVLIGTVLTSILVIRHIAEKDGGYTELYKSAAFIALLIGGIGIFMLAAAKATKGIGNISTMTTVGLGKLTKQTTSAIGGITDFIWSIIPLIGMMVASIYILSKINNLNSAMKAFTVVMIAVAALVTSVFVLTFKLSKVIASKNLNLNGVTGGIKVALHEISGIMQSMSWFMIAFATSAAMLSIIPKDKQEFALKMMGLQAAIMIAVIAGAGLIVSMLSKRISAMNDLTKSGQLTASLHHVGVMIAEIMGAMMTMTLAVIGSVALLSIIPSSKLKQSVGSFIVLMATMTLAIMLIVRQTREFTNIIGTESGFSNKSVTMMATFGAQLGMVVGAVSGMMLAATASLAILSKVDTKQMLASSLILGGMMVAMLLFTKSLVSIFKVTDTLHETMNSKASGKNAKTLNSKSNITKTLTTYLDNTGMMIMQVCGGMSALMVSMAVAIKLLGTMNVEQLLIGGGAFIIAFGAIMGATVLLLRIIQSTAKQMGQVNFNKESFKFIYSISAIMMSMTGAIITLMGTIAVLAVVLDEVKISSIILSLVTLTLIFGALMGIVAAVTTLANKIVFTDSTVRAVETLLLEVALLMAISAGSIMAIAGAAKIFDRCNPKTVLITLGAMAGIYAALFAIVGLIAKSTKVSSSINTKAITSMTNSITVLIAGMVSSVVALAAASVLMNYGNVNGTIFMLLSVLGTVFAVAILANTVAEKIEQGTIALQKLLPFLSSLTSIVVAFGVTALLLGLVNWENIQKHLGAFAAVVGGLAVLVLAMSYGAAVAEKGALVVLAIGGSIVTIAIAIAFAAKTISSAFALLIQSFNEMSKLDWSPITASAAQFKTTMTLLSEAVAIGAKNVLAAYLVGKGVYYLITGLSVLETINPSALSSGAAALKSAVDVLAESWKPLVAILGLVALTGPALAVGLAIVGLSILIILAMIPKMVEATDKAIAAVAQFIGNIEKNIEVIIDSMKALKDFIGAEDLSEMIDQVSLLALLGILMLAAGATLAVGTIAFMIGAVLLGPAVNMLKYSLNILNDLVGAGTVMNGIDAVALLFDFGILLIACSAILGIGVSIALPTFALLFASMMFLSLALSKIDAVLAGTWAFLENIEWFGLAAVGLIAVGALMLIAGVLLGTACAVMIPALILLAGTVGIIYFIANYMTTGDILNGSLGVLIIFGVLLTIGIVAMAISPILILGLLGLTIAAALFMTTSIMLTIGVISFTVALLAIWGATLILDQIDFSGLGEKMMQLLSFVGAIAIIGAVMLVAGIVLTFAGIFLTIASVLVCTAIITFAVTLLVGAALLLASGYILEMAFNQIFVVFENNNFLNMTVQAITMALFGLVLGIAAGLLLAGSIVLLVSSAILLVGAGILGAALLSLKKGTEKGINVLEFAKNMGTFIGAIVLLSVGSALMLPAAITLTVFGGILLAASVTIETAVMSLATTSELLQTSIEGFKNAGEMICEGITEGIQEGANRVSSAVEELAEGDVLGAFKSVLGINSPAEEFIENAAMCIAGIVEGFGGDKDKAYNAVKSVGMGMLNTFDGMTDGFKSVGNNLADSFNSGFGAKLKDGFNEIASGFVGDIGGLANLVNGITTESDAVLEARMNYLANVGKSREQWYWDEYQRVKKEAEAMGTKDYESEAKKLLGTGDYYSGGATDIDYGALAGETSDALSGVNTGKTASDASKIGGNVGTSVTNNTYNFTQNNFSPEPIDRTEIYTQTNNQLDTWYKWLRDNS